MGFKSYPLAGVFSSEFADNAESTGFKSYPLAGVFSTPSCSAHQSGSFKSYPLAGVFFNGDSPNCADFTVSSHTPLRGYSFQKGRSGKDSGSFKSYPLAGVFGHRPFSMLSHEGFKSYPLAGVFALMMKWDLDSPVFQVIPPCGGIPAAKRMAERILIVSSHTPLRGYSDLMDFREEPGENVSSHTPLRGYSGGRGRCFCRSVCFKSYPLAGVFSKLSSCASAGTSFQVIPPCGGILGNNTAITAISIQFQVIPPCGGIPACYPAISANSYTSFKSYPLAGVFSVHHRSGACE